MGGYRITGVGQPTNSGDAAEFDWVNKQIHLAAAGIVAKPVCRVVSTADIELNGLQEIDGVEVAALDRVLVVGQENPRYNGVYLAKTTAWTRALDSDESIELRPGSFWYVAEGASYEKTQWIIQNTTAITLGSTDIYIVQFSGPIPVLQAGNCLERVGDTFNVKVGSGLKVVNNTLTTDNMVTLRKFTTLLGDDINSAFNVTHNLNSRAITVSIWDQNTGGQVDADVTITGTNNISVSFYPYIPFAAEFSVVVTG